MASDHLAGHHRPDGGDVGRYTRVVFDQGQRTSRNPDRPPAEWVVYVRRFWRPQLFWGRGFAGVKTTSPEDSGDVVLAPAAVCPDTTCQMPRYDVAAHNMSHFM